MEIVAKISKGSRMDQIYIPKSRYGFNIGEYVIVKPFREERPPENIYFKGIEYLESIKIGIIKEIIEIIDKLIENENIIVTGSFLDKGFSFNDVDILIITKSTPDEIDINDLKKKITEKEGINPHIIILDSKTIMHGLSKDPLYILMLSRCVSKKRFIYKSNINFNYKLLDLHLLKSKTLIDNFDFLNGHEKYGLLRNMIAISIFLDNKKLDGKNVENKIKIEFGLEVNKVKQNLINRDNFIKKYRSIYNKTYDKILEGIKNASKQK